MLAKIIDWFTSEGLRWVRYAYFLRFSIFLWVFAPLLCGLNFLSQTLTSGILVAEYGEQYICDGVFLIGASLASLVLARIVLINGQERFGDPCPQLLKTIFVNDPGHTGMDWLALLLALAPNGLAMLYILHFGTCQGVDAGKIIWGLLAGVFMGLFQGWLANAWYYLVFTPPLLDTPPTTFVLGQNAARTILLPRWCFRLNRIGSPLPGSPTIEQATTLISSLRDRLDRRPWIGQCRLFLAKQRGFGREIDERASFYEAHTFAAILLVAFTVLYLLIWPTTAPVPAHYGSALVMVLLFVFLAFIALVFWKATPASVKVDGQEKKDSLLWIQLTITICSLLFFAMVIYLYCCTSIERFPILATVLIMLTCIAWVVAGIAFFFDRYRVPVLTLLIAAVFVPRLLHLDRTIYWDGGLLPHAGNSQEEHYFSITCVTDGKDGCANATAEIPAPADFLQSRLGKDSKPLIIVTATGGGLHASAWTAAVLAHLEEQSDFEFHDHLLLASTVSGGSVGLLAYLRELHERTLDLDPNHRDQSLARAQAALARMQSAAQCSSLEGVGWGLVYYDFPKAFVPFLPYLVPPSSGFNDLHTGPGGGTPLFNKDRTWALRAAFNRNLRSTYCQSLWESDTGSSPNWVLVNNGNANGSGLTVRNFLPAGTYPAFTMNTTVVESGERFLVGNYKIPYFDLETDGGPNYRARSFLETYKTVQIGMTKGSSDVPLATAAQLSATFPYVSSQARAPIAVDNAGNSAHFADGGYYDNDGTASAVEFLRYALSAPSSSGTEPLVDVQHPGTLAHPVRILLIEIRNSGGIAGSNPETVPNHFDDNDPWDLLNQTSGPLLGFWQAGHESVTARDQSALELLAHAYGENLIIKAVVLADDQAESETGTDPLNWSLTPRQRKEVRTSAAELQCGYETAAYWMNADEATWRVPETGVAESHPTGCNPH